MSPIRAADPSDAGSQGGFTLSAWPAGPSGRRRDAHRRLGALVQRRPAHAPPGPYPTDRIRGNLLGYKHSPTRGCTPITTCAPNPGQFTEIHDDGGPNHLTKRELGHFFVVRCECAHDCPIEAGVFRTILQRIPREPHYSEGAHRSGR